MLTAQLPIVSPPTRASSIGMPNAPARAHTAMPVSVGALLLSVAGGDAPAFTTLYERTSHRVYGLVRKVLMDPEMSAETTQDVYLALCWMEQPVSTPPRVPECHGS